MVKKIRKKERGKVSRERKKVILIGCEGKNKTETIYFKNFHPLLKNYTINFSCGNNTDSLGVVNNTIHSMQDGELNIAEGDLAFCLIDYDTKIEKSHESKVNQAIKKAEKSKVHILISNPIFEIWFLLHFRYSTKHYETNDEVLKDLSKYIEDYTKSKDVFSYLYPNSSQAIENAKKLIEHHKDEKKISNRNPSTDVYELVERLLEDINS